MTKAMMAVKIIILSGNSPSSSTTVELERLPLIPKRLPIIPKRLPLIPKGDDRFPSQGTEFVMGSNCVELESKGSGSVAFGFGGNNSVGFEFGGNNSVRFNSKGIDIESVTFNSRGTLDSMPIKEKFGRWLETNDANVASGGSEDNSFNMVLLVCSCGIQIQIFIVKTTELYTILNKYLFIEIRIILLITIKPKTRPKIGFLRQL